MPEEKKWHSYSISTEPLGASQARLPAKMLESTFLSFRPIPPPLSFRPAGRNLSGLPRWYKISRLVRNDIPTHNDNAARNVMAGEQPVLFNAQLPHHVVGLTTNSPRCHFDQFYPCHFDLSPHCHFDRQGEIFPGGPGGTKFLALLEMTTRLKMTRWLGMTITVIL
jgi:hypothetical protein